MITRTQAYQVGEETFATLELAQSHALEELLSGVSLDQVPAKLVEQKDKILDILTTGPRSKPKARKINGASKKRAVKSAMDVLLEQP